MVRPIGNIVGAYNAKTRLAELLQRVEAGDEITITKHGVPVAKLVPVKRTKTVSERRAAIQRIEALSKRVSLGGLKIKDLVSEGRR